MSNAHSTIRSPVGRIKVLIVDDNATVRHALTTFLLAFDDLDLVGEAASGREAVDLCLHAQPDVVLMDLTIPGMSGAAAIRAIRGRWPNIQVIALITFQEIDLAREAVEAGAICCLLKNVTADELAEAIRAAVASPLDPPPGDGSDLDPHHLWPPALSPKLKPCDRQMLAMLVRSLDLPQIAERLRASYLTARFYIDNLFGKVGVADQPWPKR